jgi:Cohesin domain
MKSRHPRELLGDSGAQPNSEALAASRDSLAPRPTTEGRRNVRKALVAVSALVGLSMVLEQPLRAGIVTFTAGDVNGAPGATLDVPVTVQSFDNLIGVQFTLTWDASQLTSPSIVGVNSALSSGASYYLPAPGTAEFTWFNAAGVTLSDNTVMFSLQITAPTTPGTTSVSFITDPNTTYVPAEVTFYDGTTGNPSNGGMAVVSGSVDPAPEPVNYALVLFACLFLGSAAFRRFSLLRARQKISYTLAARSFSLSRGASDEHIPGALQGASNEG